jgi:DNA-binding response OmpR family regulator
MNALENILFVSTAPDPELLQSLDLDGITAHVVSSAREAVDVMQHANVGMVLLDVSLGAVETMRTSRRLVEASSTPVILWADGLTESERVAASLLGVTEILNAGLDADGVSTRIRRRLRELTAVVRPNNRAIQVGSLSIDAGRRRVFVGAKETVLTKIEFELLAALATRPGEVRRRQDIISEVWGDAWYGAPNVLDTHIAHLRNKLAGADCRSCIVTVRGVGYCLDPDTVAAAS